MSTALILVDIQNDYFPNGKMELNNPVKAVNKGYGNDSRIEGTHV